MCSCILDVSLMITFFEATATKFYKRRYGCFAEQVCVCLHGVCDFSLPAHAISRNPDVMRSTLHHLIASHDDSVDSSSHLKLQESSATLEVTLVWVLICQREC